MLAGGDERQAGRMQLAAFQLQVPQRAELKQRLKAACNFLVNVRLSGAQRSTHLHSPTEPTEQLQAQA
jgi:hypothetical protein